MRRRHVWLAWVSLLPMVLIGCGDDSSSENAGQPGDKARAARVVDVRQLDSHRFEPATFDAKAGETVTFRVTNAGSQIHDFFLGNVKAHDERDKEMKAMGSSPMQMRDMPNGLTIDPGATEELTWTFPDKGTVVFGCHQPGHYDDGMKGQVKVG